MSGTIKFASAIIATFISCSLWDSTAAFAVQVNPVTKPWIRLNQGVDHLRIDPKNKFGAFISDNGMGLNVIDLKTKKLFSVSHAQVGSSFFWSPDGYRLFFRELTKDKSGKIRSELRAYDCYLHQAVTIESMNYPTGVLTFDPRDLRMHLMSSKGIKTRRIYFPDERLARWQVAQRTEKGKWIVTQRGVLWVTQGGFAMRKLEDDGSPIESFDVSPDGSMIVWATENGKIYTNRGGRPAKFLDHGRDPKWHPDKLRLIYAGARMVGRKAVSYDIKVSDMTGSKRYLTSTQFTDERWPQWNKRRQQIVYTKANTTDIYVLNFKE